MQLRSALLAATILATPIAASAQPVTGLYIGGGVGVNFTQKENVSGASVGLAALIGAFLSTNGNINGSTGFAGLVNVGWGFGNGLRAEIEGNYRNNQSGFANGNFANFGDSALAAVPESRSSAAWSTRCTTSMACRLGSCPISASASVTSASPRSGTRNNNFALTVPRMLPGVTCGTGSDLRSQGVSRSSGQSTKGAFAYQAILGAAMPLQIGHAWLGGDV